MDDFSQYKVSDEEDEEEDFSQYKVKDDLGLKSKKPSQVKFAKQFAAGVGDTAAQFFNEVKTVGTLLNVYKQNPNEKQPTFAEKFEIGEPENQLERYARTSGSWLPFGVTGGAAGIFGATASGAAFQGFIESGLDEWQAAVLTALLHFSPKVAKGLAEKFRKNVPITPKEQRQLTHAVQSFEKPNVPPDIPPPGGGGGGGGNNTGKITAPPEFLRSDFEVAEEIQNALSPLNIEANGKVNYAPFVEELLEPVNPILNEITPHRVNDTKFIGRSISSIVKTESEIEYAQTQKLWNTAKEEGKGTVLTREDLTAALRDLSEEINRPTAGAEGKVKNYAEDLYNSVTVPKKKLVKGKPKIVRVPKPVSNSQLIEAIINARKGYDYRFKGGVEGHRINQFINLVENELIHSSTEAERQALLRARNATREWATTFKNPNVLPFRNEIKVNPVANNEKALNPDVFDSLLPILERSPRKESANILKRNAVERILQKHLANPANINPLKFEQDMIKLRQWLPESQVQKIETALQNKQHQLLNQPHLPLSQKSSFLGLDSTQVARKLKTIEGLRELKEELKRARPNDWKELYDKISKTQGVDLLFGGEFDVPTNAKRIEKMLNSRNERFYLKETLGEENVKQLDKLVAEGKLEERLSKGLDFADEALSHAHTSVEISRVIYNLIRGNFIKAAKAGIGVVKDIKGKISSSKTSTPKPNATIT